MILDEQLCRKGNVKIKTACCSIKIVTIYSMTVFNQMKIEAITFQIKCYKLVQECS